MQRVILDEDLALGLDKSQVFFDDEEDAEYNFPADHRNLDKVPFIWSGTHSGENCLVNPDAHPSCPRGKIEDLEPFGAGCSQPGTPSQRLARRAGVCVVRPGNGGGRGPGAIGDPITFRPGPASPTCVPGSPGCGTLCRGYYCVPQPTGFPPDRWDPEDPAHQPTRRTTATPTRSLPTPSSTSCASYTTTTVCNGSGGRSVCVPSSSCATPTLPPLDEDGPYSGPGCATYTPTTVCNGSGGRSVCVTGRICIPTHAPCPAWPTIGTPRCPPDFPTCLRTTQVTLCALKQRTVEARLTPPPSPPTPTPTPPAAAQAVGGRFFQRRDQPQQQQQQQQQKPTVPLEPVLIPEDATLDDLVPAAAVADNNGISTDNTTSVLDLELAPFALNKRQDIPWGCGGHETGGCTVYTDCQQGFCARAERVSCVLALIRIEMHPIDTEVMLSVYENGELMCSRSIKCLTILSPDCLIDQSGGEFDCGTGRVTSWENGLSTVVYVSGAGRRYVMYLGQEGGDQFRPCQVAGRLIALCVDSDWAGYDGLCRTLLKPRERRLELGMGRWVNETVPVLES
ncbi:hypothetical protein N657DRAFT_148252 [Parathielavia appendiculata]|uniref:Uncharacterized protein n=1 Tax=Parathielavia appendiculata TaxID=2587402 RepID=A0AAN6TVX8_9PEZI|nr:hypothetical protein N657DRAFT_148252 [Parathielavia appendiculata]